VLRTHFRQFTVLISARCLLFVNGVVVAAGAPCSAYPAPWNLCSKGDSPLPPKNRLYESTISSTVTGKQFAIRKCSLLFLEAVFTTSLCLLTSPLHSNLKPGIALISFYFISTRIAFALHNAALMLREKPDRKSTRALK